MSSPTLNVCGGPLSGVAGAQVSAVRWLAGRQRPDGHWCAHLTADSTLESDYILLQIWLHPPRGSTWMPPTRPLIDKAARAILERQLPDGGFNIYPQGPSEISATVKAYCALKLAGIPVDDPRLARARDRILELGGIQAANSYVKINLSLFGLYPREHCPAMAPELMLLPFGFIYQMSSWTRAIVVSLSIVHAANPMRPVPAGFNLDELFRPGVPLGFRNSEGFFGWRNLFLQLDWAAKWWERNGIAAVRRRAVRKAAAWMLERLERSDGLGAIYPPMMYSIMALDVLGYPEDHPLRREALRQFDNLMHDEDGRFFFEPCFSAVWDTAIAAYALARSAAEPSARAAVGRAASWLVEREIRERGDWSFKRPRTEPSGWAFEYRNDYYPDIDDTAMVLLALTEAGGHAGAVERGMRWLLDMQSRDGGWAAFDVDNNWEFLSRVPFADHNAMLDPTCPDITGRVLEALAAQGLAHDHPAVRRGVAYLVRRQEADGSWYGRWGVAYIYGTCFALRGLEASGESDREAYVLRGGEWLRSVQNADGGWGESCASYDQGTYVPAPSTPSQTAWALLGLMAGGDTGSRSVQQGIEYLLRTQRPEGTWDEELATGTGFPKVFYLNYHLYRHYFPLLALSTYLKHNEGTGSGRAGG